MAFLIVQANTRRNFLTQCCVALNFVYIDSIYQGTFTANKNPKNLKIKTPNVLPLIHNVQFLIVDSPKMLQHDCQQPIKMTNSGAQVSRPELEPIQERLRWLCWSLQIGIINNNMGWFTLMETISWGF